jgi:Pro-kumamolisin, activation domain
MRRGRTGSVGLTIGLVAVVGAVLMLSAARARAVAPGRAAGQGPVLTFYFGLKRPESKAVGAFWAVQQPGSETYRRFVTRAELARRYGAAPATRRAFIGGMRQLGLTASIDPTGVFARVNGTKSQLERAFHVTITGTFDDLSTSYVANRPLRLPAAVKPLVREVIASFTRTTAPSSTASLAPLSLAAPRPKNAGRWIRGCAAARHTGGYSFGQIRHAYGVDRVGAGDGGSLAILNDQETTSPSDNAELERCFGYPAHRVRSLFTDRQTHGFFPETPEPAEDLGLVRGIAPQLRSVLQTDVWGASELWFLGPARLLRQSRLPDALSISYGYCERTLMSMPVQRAAGRLLNAMFVRLGLAGVGVFGSAGDSGSTCNGKPFRGTAWPADSPYVTSVGGTRLAVNRSNQRVSEVVWNDLSWLKPADGGGAGGGGLSLAPRPPYQRYISVPGNRRATPDIAVHASMLPGYPILANGQWVLDGGTSAAAPLAAAAFSTLSARLRAAGEPPLGPVNGLVYWLQRHRATGLYDIVSGNNQYDRKVPGYRAHRGYDLASGVGVPRFDRIARLVPAPGRR